MLERAVLSASEAATVHLPACTTAVICHTPELQNVIRTGVPPVLTLTLTLTLTPTLTLGDPLVQQNLPLAA